MNPAEYHQMAALEREHWWYNGLRDLLARVLRNVPRRNDLAVLDAGCGTGENLRLLSEMLSPAYLGGFDASPLALDYAARKNPAADVYRSDICSPELRVAALDVILCCDVLYVPGIDRALPGLQTLIAALRPGGLFIVNVPAYNWLRSRHDAAIHTTQRFTRGDIGRLFRTLGLDSVVLTYRMCLLFPLVVAARLPSILRPPRDPAAARSDLVLPSKPVNAALRQVLGFENALIAAGMNWPLGSSVFGVGRKSCKKRQRD